ncbi:MAG TPA: HAD-IA family hydrolase [Pedococcus sp.]
MTSLRWPVVLFDLDGTVADTIGLIVASYNHAFRTVTGTERDEAEIRSWIGRPLIESFAAVAPGHAEELDRVYREWNLAHTEELLRPYPGIAELLVDLSAAGARTGVVTSKRRETAALALRGVGVDGLVPLLATLEDTTAHKPSPDPLLHGARVLGVDPGRCVYVGDAAVDVAAARAAGMAAVGVTWGAVGRDALEEAGPDAVVDTVAELRQVVGLPGTPTASRSAGCRTP